jgi:hypothetical protein
MQYEPQALQKMIFFHYLDVSGKSSSYQIRDSYHALRKKVSHEMLLVGFGAVG